MFPSQYLYNGYYTFQPIFPCSFFVSLKCEHLELEGLLSSYLNVFLTMYVKIMFPMAYINVYGFKANVNSINRYMPPVPTR